MAIVTLAAQKAHMHVDFTDDDMAIEALIDAAQAHLEQLLGYEIAVEFEEDGAPADIILAVKMQAAHLYEHRESSVSEIAIAELPMGFWDIVRERRRYSF